MVDCGETGKLRIAPAVGAVAAETETVDCLLFLVYLLSNVITGVGGDARSLDRIPQKK